MNAFLWTVAIFAGVNLVCWIGHLTAGRVPETTPAARFIDNAVTTCLGLWAFWLLAKGGVV